MTLLIDLRIETLWSTLVDKSRLQLTQGEFKVLSIFHGSIKAFSSNLLSLILVRIFKFFHFHIHMFSKSRRILKSVALVHYIAVHIVLYLHWNARAYPLMDREQKDHYPKIQIISTVTYVSEWDARGDKTVCPGANTTRVSMTSILKVNFFLTSTL
jgi:hypothetical protein